MTDVPAIVIVLAGANVEAVALAPGECVEVKTEGDAQVIGPEPLIR